mgnify:CR=1 FL=1
MKNVFVFMCCFSLILWACKPDNPNEKQQDKTNVPIKKLNENEVLAQAIKTAYNTKKFQQETQVKFNLKLKVEDTLYFNGFVSLKTDASQIYLLSSQVDTVLNAQKLNRDFDKILFWSAEVYALPFWIQSDDFKINTKNDSLVTTHYKSNLTTSDFDLFTHPMTHIIQKLNYQMAIKTKPFDRGQLYFNRYITVNRIPVAMQWRIEVDGELKAEAKISRISYPEQF